MASDLFGGVAPWKARSEEDDGILDLLAAKAGERFLIFREDAQNASIGAVDELWVLVGQRGGFEFIDHVVIRVLDPDYLGG